MKKTLALVVGSIYTFLWGISIALAQTMPKPDMSVWESDKMKPIRDFANITIGIILGIAVLYGVIMVAYYGIELQTSGSNLIKSQEAKSGLKATVVGFSLTVTALFSSGWSLYVLGLTGLKGN